MRFLLLLLSCIVLFLNPITAQQPDWEPTSGLYGEGFSFHQPSPGPPGFLYALEGNDAFSGTSEVVRSTDDGRTWEVVHATDPAITHTMMELWTDEQGLMLGLWGRTYKRSTDAGATWTALTTPTNAASGVSLDGTGKIFLWTGDGMNIVYLSTNRGTSWSRKASPGGRHGIITKLVYGESGMIFAQKNDGRIYYSLNSGTSWRMVALSAIHGVRPTGHMLNVSYHSASHTLLALATLPRNNPPVLLLQSQDNGHRWGIVDLDTSAAGGSIDLAQLHFTRSAAGDVVLLQRSGYDFSLVKLTPQGGATWKAAVFQPRTESNGRHYNVRYAFQTSTGGLLLTLVGDGIERSDDGMTPWSLSDIRCGGSAQRLVTAPNGRIYATRRESIFRSTDNGVTWSQPGPFPDGSGIRVDWLNGLVVRPNGELIAGTLMERSGTLQNVIFRSTDEGTTWIEVPNPMNRVFLGINTVGDIITLKSDGGGPTNIHRTTDNGLTWQNVYAAAWSSFANRMTTMPDGNLYIPNGAFDGGAFHSSDDGATWERLAIYDSVQQRSMPVAWVTACPGGTLFAWDYYSYRSTNGGTSWSRMNEHDPVYNAPRFLFAAPNGTLFIGAPAPQRSTDNGNSWTSQVAGLLDYGINAMVLTADGHLLAGTSMHGVERSTTTFPNLLQPSMSARHDMPGYSMRQNYPNPFNPVTEIAFDLPSTSRVSMDVYNILGQRVATLAEGEIFEAGSHALRFDGYALPSGVYFCRLSASLPGGIGEQFTQVKEMLLVK